MNYSDDQKTKVNHLGRRFIVGRPLPEEMRMEIITLAQSGFKISAISRKLRVTNSGVRRIIEKFNETGSLEPGYVGLTRINQLDSRMVEAIFHLNYVLECPPAHVIFNHLINDNYCDLTNAPSIGLIKRILKIRSGKRARIKFTDDQLNVLNSVFEKNRYPTCDQCDQIGLMINVPSYNVRCWFKNKRAKHKQRNPNEKLDSGQFKQNKCILDRQMMNNLYERNYQQTYCNDYGHYDWSFKTNYPTIIYSRKSRLPQNRNDYSNYDFNQSRASDNPYNSGPNQSTPNQIPRKSAQTPSSFWEKRKRFLCSEYRE